MSEATCIASLIVLRSMLRDNAEKDADRARRERLEAAQQGQEAAQLDST
jgi:hypothetical protein